MTGLRLTIATPNALLVDDCPVRCLQAEDPSGSFGLLPGHADFLTVLGPSIVRWKDPGEIRHFCAVRAGVLNVRKGQHVGIACREGILGDDLDSLEQVVRSMREADLDAIRRAQVEQTRLHAQVVRQLMRHLQDSRRLVNITSAPDQDLS